jgi:hypothetical protein
MIMRTQSLAVREHLKRVARSWRELAAEIEDRRP